ncbi:MAG TPA: hypothetical protein DCO78_04150, partial [Chitinophagaceae bacterium]|nr:hypothetical protein [Chitinophagaceae bacterium]
VFVDTNFRPFKSQHTAVAITAPSTPARIRFVIGLENGVLQFNGLAFSFKGVIDGLLPRCLTGILRKNTPLKKREISPLTRPSGAIMFALCLNSEGEKFHWGLNITTGCFLAAVVFLELTETFFSANDC